MKTVLVLGGSGCLGTALRQEFILQGFNVLAPSSRDLNLMDFEAVSNYFYDFKNDIDYIIHAAGFVGGLYHNLNSNIEFFEKNFDIGYNVTNAMVLGGIKAKILYFASSCMYNANLIPPYKEENLFDPIEEDSQDNWGYAKAKQFVSKLVLGYKIGTVIVPPNLYGVRRLKDAENINNKHLLETIAYKYALTGEVDFKCSKDIRREILSAKELARVCVKHLDLFLKESIAINVGTGYSVSMEQISERLYKHEQFPFNGNDVKRIEAKVSFDDKAYSSLKDKFMNTSKFETLTGEKLECFTGFREYINNPFTLN